MAFSRLQKLTTTDQLRSDFRIDLQQPNLLVSRNSVSSLVVCSHKIDPVDCNTKTNTMVRNMAN